MKKKAWSPYLCGIVIGLLQIPAFLLARAFLGTSTTYVRIVGHVFGFLGLSTESFSKFLTMPKFTWQFGLVIGIVVGAYLSSRLSGLKRKNPSPIFSGKRYRTAFFGGFLLIFGARLAGGCTSGHGISGAAQFSVSSWIAVSMMFAAGIALTAILRRRTWSPA